MAQRREELGNEHPETLDAITALAYALKKESGRVADAVRLYTEALDGRRVLLGSRHPATLIAINNLAMAKYAQGNVGAATKLVNEALKGRQKVSK